MNLRSSIGREDVVLGDIEIRRGSLDWEIGEAGFGAQLAVDWLWIGGLIGVVIEVWM